MDLKNFLKSKSIADRKVIANEAGTTVEYFWQLAGGHRKPSLDLAEKIEKATNGDVTLLELRPDMKKYLGSVEKPE